jgi:signal peptidase I
MYPAMNAGDLVISIRTSLYVTNDIVTYKTQAGTFITHRVVSKKASVFLTKGDANNTLDNPVKLNDIQGKVIFIFKMPRIFRRI